MSKVLSAISGRKRQRPGYLTTMFCLDCDRIFQASRISSPCPGCASGQVIAAARWAPAKYGMPRLTPAGGDHGS